MTIYCGKISTQGCKKDECLKYLLNYLLKINAFVFLVRFLLYTSHEIPADSDLLFIRWL